MSQENFLNRLVIKFIKDVQASETKIRKLERSGSGSGSGNSKADSS